MQTMISRSAMVDKESYESFTTMLDKMKIDFLNPKPEQEIQPEKFDIRKLEHMARTTMPGINIKFRGKRLK